MPGSESSMTMLLQDPPSYTSTDESTSHGSKTGPLPPLPPRYALPTGITEENYISVVTPEAPVHGIWVVNPEIPPPEGPENFQPRENIALEGSIVKAHIFVVATRTNLDAKDVTPVRIKALTIMRSLNLRVHDVLPADGMDDVQRRSISISCFNRRGHVRVYLPRSFRGPIRIRTPIKYLAYLHYSKAVSKNLALILTAPGEGVQCAFLGDKEGLAEWENKRSRWTGDTLSVQCNGFVGVWYDDEASIPTKPHVDTGCIVC